MTPQTLRGLLPRPEVTELDNGLRIAVLRNEGVPLVATAMVYAAGTRDDPEGHGGTAHFLEHMMFKGSSRFGPGEIDRQTRALGGSNNAYTGHDNTLYHFKFAADRWRRALDIEIDRMTELTLDPAEVDSERRVIVEEIAMFEGEPWDALEQEVMAAFFGGHPYGQPVLGTRRSLASTDAAILREFHRALYRPSNAVLVLAGAVGRSAGERAAGSFAGLPARGSGGGPRSAATAGDLGGADGEVRVVRHQGEVARMLLTLPAPRASDPDHPRLRLLLSVLAAGRSSRLHRSLVDEGQLCVWVAADLGETVDPGVVSIAAEVLPGVEPGRVEATVGAELARLRAEPPDEEEIARARKIVLADWVFAHEKVDQQAVWTGTHLSLFDLEHPWRYLDREIGAGPDDLLEMAVRYLDPERRCVVGWSLPRS